MERIKYDGNQIVSWDKCGWKPKQATTTLSAAIRMGAKATPENDGTSFLCGGTCAVGAAFYAIFGHTDSHRSGATYERVANHFGISNEKWNRLAISMVYLTEVRNGPGARERVADWLEGQGL